MIGVLLSLFTTSLLPNRIVWRFYCRNGNFLILMNRDLGHAMVTHSYTYLNSIFGSLYNFSQEDFFAICLDVGIVASTALLVTLIYSTFYISLALVLKIVFAILGVNEAESAQPTSDLICSLIILLFRLMTCSSLILWNRAKQDLLYGHRTDSQIDSNHTRLCWLLLW